MSVFGSLSRPGPLRKETLRVYQCPGCWSIGMYPGCDAGQTIECDCGEKMATIDLRDSEHVREEVERERANWSNDYYVRGMDKGVRLALEPKRLALEFGLHVYIQDDPAVCDCGDWDAWTDPRFTFNDHVAEETRTNILRQMGAPGQMTLTEEVPL